MRIALFIAAGCLQLAAQSVQLGSASDPCIGGTAWSVPGSPISTLRYSSTPFACTFSAGAPGAYLVELDFVEPSVTVPASDPGGRAFDVTVTDAWGFQEYGRIRGMDLFTMGATSPAVVIARSFLVLSGDGKIRVALSTVKRSAVISRVIILPYTAFMAQAKSQKCIGSSCAGLELLTVGTRSLVAMPATKEAQALPRCSSDISGTCWNAGSQ